MHLFTEFLIKFAEEAPTHTTIFSAVCSAHVKLASYSLACPARCWSEREGDLWVGLDVDLIVVSFGRLAERHNRKRDKVRVGGSVDAAPDVNIIRREKNCKL